MQEGNPLRVLRAVHHEPVAPVAFPHTKIVLVTSGWTHLTHRDYLVPLAEGDISILPSGARVGGEPLPTAETVTLYLNPDYLRQQLTWTHRQVPLAALLDSAADGAGDIVPISPPAQRRRALIDQARALAHTDSARSAPSLRLLGGALSLIATLDLADGLARPVIPRREVRVTVEAMRADITRRWTATDLSRAVSLSHSQLVRLFNAAFGEPPITVLQRLRAEHLASLLLTTNWSVQRCAAAVGWNDAGHASRMMIRFHGLTPSRYRRMIHHHR